jgi:FkbM family methyltransferase
MTDFIAQCESMAGKSQFQKFFEQLYQVALKGMNIGAGSFTFESGEPEVIQYVKSKINSPEGIVIFDVGANVGSYASLLERKFGKGAIIHSFEPSAATFAKLTANVGTHDNIILHNFGLGDKEARTTLYTDSDESGLASLYKRRLDHFNIFMNKTEAVSIRALDSFCESENIKHIHFLKLDVEGNEIKVLHGAQRMLKADAIDFIQFEFGGCNIDSRTYFQDFYYLLGEKYKLYRIVKDGLYAIEQYKEMYECFVATNYLAEKKRLPAGAPEQPISNG